MPPLQEFFSKPSFAVKDVVVNPYDDRRGRIKGFNIVAQGDKPNEQVIILSFGADVDRKNISEKVDAIKLELIH